MFSTVTGVFHASLSFCANRRAVMSVALPAVKPTMMRTGLDRRSCARAIRDTDGSAAAPAARCRKFRRGSFTSNLPLASFDHLVGDSEHSVLGRRGARHTNGKTQPS